MTEDQPPSEGRPPRDDSTRAGGVSRRDFIQTLGVSAAAGALAGSAEPASGQARAADEVDLLGPGPIDVRLRVNGQPLRATIDPATTLLEALRIHLSMTGSKEVCDRGACGGCSVLVDGRLTASCMLLAVDAVGSEITTIEGLARGPRLDPIQESFIRHDALQCGFCTPGLILAAKALLNENPKPALDEIKRGLSGNLCRCGAYPNVFNAVLEASGQSPVADGQGAAP
jgi:xanthine dehydrogenase YagT iron-sulfur-binding subunit